MVLVHLLKDKAKTVEVFQFVNCHSEGHSTKTVVVSGEKKSEYAPRVAGCQ